MQDQTIADDTIFALSSGTLPSGVAVIRMSGPHAQETLRELTGSDPQERVAQLRALRDPHGVLIDRGVCLYFKGPASFTGEDCAELQVHGGKAVVAKLLDVLAAMPHLRAAEAGEFTRRAYLNGKLDLANAEALSDLISAETEAQRRFAIANTSDKHRQLYDGWRRQLIEARALIEAELDFSDEGDVPGSVSALVWNNVEELQRDIEDHAKSYRTAEIIRDGLKVVILGAPNAGKSSLLNALAQRDVAIVSDEAGTTRDILEVHLDLGGVKVSLADTAGIREAEGKIEAIGIQRSLERARNADLVLQVEDLAAPVELGDLPSTLVLRIGTKADLLPSYQGGRDYDCILSSRTGEGIEKIVSLLQSQAQAFMERSSDILPFRARHVDLLQEALTHMERARAEQELELAAESLRLASNALGRVCGHIDVEDLLDSIFSAFCIGK